MNRVIAASAGKRYGMQQLKRVLVDPNDNVARTALETVAPFGEHINERFDRVMRTTVKSQGGRSITPDDVDWVMEQQTSVIEQERPELMVVRDYINAVAKTVSDVTQHRLQPADRVQLLNTNPIIKAAFSLQSFNLKQTEFIKNVIVREARIAAAYAAAGNGASGALKGAAARSLAFMPKVFGAWGFGFTAIAIGHAVRFKGFDEDDLTIMAGLYQVGLGGYLAEFFNSAQYYKGLQSFALGPGISTALDLAQDPVGTVGGFSFPIGPTFKNYGVKSNGLRKRRDYQS